jgi:hypothetical protein
MKLNIHFTCDVKLPFLPLSPKEMIEEKFIQIFTAALFIISLN